MGCSSDPTSAKSIKFPLERGIHCSKVTIYVVYEIKIPLTRTNRLGLHIGHLILEGKV